MQQKSNPEINETFRIHYYDQLGVNKSCYYLVVERCIKIFKPNQKKQSGGQRCIFSDEM